MEKAIVKAIEGGYKLKVKNFGELIKDYTEIEDWEKIFSFVRQEDLEPYILLDPLFWQALGKVEDWGGTEEEPKWSENWHDFIDHLANNGDITNFFNNLLK